MRDPKLIDKFAASLPPHSRHLLASLLDVARSHDLPLYLVGGPLRDLLIGRSSLDVDIAVEGDAIALARDLAASTAGRTVTHLRFGTATVRSDSSHLDLITARSETYSRPGALPTVRPATIREDLLRRDFTINAMALCLTGPLYGEVLDPASGLQDLEARLIRALHERSFQDDATRILRAFRYAARLGFEIEPQTLAWLKRDLSYLDTISCARLHHEFSRILSEDEPEKALRCLHDVGALAAVHPVLRFEPEQAEAFARLRDLHSGGARAAYWPILAWCLSEAAAASLARRLALTKAQRAALEAMPVLTASVAQHLQVRGASIKRSALAEILSPFSLPALWALAALTDDPTVRHRLLDYLMKARHERPRLTGGDLLALGVPPGPALGDLLRQLRNARLDGELRAKRGELSFVRDAARRGGFQTRARHRLAKAPASLPAHPEVSKE